MAMQIKSIKREQAHEEMLKAALSHSGVYEAMEVYNNWFLFTNTRM